MDKKTLLEYRLPRYDELPEIELYMDQLVSYLESHMLKSDNEKAITNTMINNYVKQGIVKAPVKKRYKRYHVAYLLAVLLLKKVYSLDEIVKLVNVQIHTYDISKAYDYFCDEFENTLRAIANNELPKELPVRDDNAETVYLLRATVKSIAYKVFVEAHI